MFLKIDYVPHNITPQNVPVLMFQLINVSVNNIYSDKTSDRRIDSAIKHYSAIGETGELHIFMCQVTIYHIYHHGVLVLPSIHVSVY